MQTIGLCLLKIFKNAGFHVFANLDYMSRIRGGNNFFQIRISDNPVFAPRQKSNIIIALDKNSVAIHQDNLSPDGILVLDKNEFKIENNDKRLFPVPFYSMAREIGGSALYINSVACGLIAGVFRLEFNYVENVLKTYFSDKSQEIIEKNISSAKAGYDYAKMNFKEDRFSAAISPAREEMLLNGNEAIGLGALYAGCKFYTAYPMTPSTSIMDLIAHYARRFGVVVEQAEDEIAAVNMAIGASFAGVRSMTATSGGGFALMVEGLSLAGMTETPLVIVDAQRPAPATGFPTRTEQADLEFLIHAGHGEFARVVYAPGTIEECFYITMKAFNLAEKYQIPVLIMTDQHLADSYRNLKALDSAKVPIQRHIISKEDSAGVTGYKRYQLTESGISPRAIPSWIKDVIYVDSDEHDETGHITEDAQMRVKMVNKRYHKKMQALFKEAQSPCVENIESARTILIGFGSTFGVMKEVCRQDKTVGFMHFSQVWPLPVTELTLPDLKGKKLLTVENNSTAQFARLIKREAGISVLGSILKYDGRPMDVEFVKYEYARFI